MPTPTSVQNIAPFTHTKPGYGLESGLEVSTHAAVKPVMQQIST